VRRTNASATAITTGAPAGAIQPTINARMEGVKQSPQRCR
jgi:hypothetical protein